MSEIYQESRVEIEVVPAPYDLLCGGSYFGVDEIRLSSGEYRRGEILVKSGDVFVKGTVSTVSSADEVCIMTKKAVIPEGSEGIDAGYFSGNFNRGHLWLNGDLLAFYQEEEIASVKASLRKHYIFVR